MSGPATTFAEHRLDVGDGHTLFVREVGNPEGAPVVWVHGGPGTGCGPGAVELFDGRLHRAVLVDQRASGRSTPHASQPDVHWGSIDMDHHVADLEAVREALGIDRWVVAGGSWGSVLGAAYAQRHPDRVVAVVLGPVTLGSRADIDHLTEDGHRYAPEAWAEFQSFAAARRPGVRLVEAYRAAGDGPRPRCPRARRVRVVSLGGRARQRRRRARGRRVRLGPLPRPGVSDWRSPAR